MKIVQTLILKKSKKNNHKTKEKKFNGRIIDKLNI